MSKVKVKNSNILIFLLILSSVLYSIYYTFINKDMFSMKISYEELTSYVANHEISTLGYDKYNHKIQGQIILQEGDGKMSFVSTVNSEEDFNKLIDDYGVSVYDLRYSSYQTKRSLFMFAVTALIIFLIICSQKMFLRKPAQVAVEEKVGEVKNPEEIKEKTTFEEVAGCAEAKENLVELIDFLKNPEKYKKYGAKIPQGTILYGPPGTGKTLLAKALAGETNSNFISAAGSEFVEKYVGVGAQRVRQIFEDARKKKPCIIFIDEIDAVGGNRNNSDSNDERKHTLNQFLSEMDGFKDNSGVIVIAATNRLEDLDAAFIRSGRFDRHICIDLPDVEARYEILKVHSRNKPLGTDVDLRDIAKQTTFMSGADLENIMNEAAIYCAKEEGEAINLRYINKAIDKVLVGEEKKNRENYKQKDKEITAYHEPGHALVSKMLAKDDIPKVTIIPTTKGAGGYTITIPEETLYNTKKQLRERLSVILAGRAEEEIIFGEENITGGASNDIQRATSLCIQLITTLGMNKRIGLVNTNYISKYSSDIHEIIFEEVKKYLDEIYEETKYFLINNKEKLIKIAQLLLEKETVYRTDLDRIIYCL